nr:unnamed protein product [Digitaria exilis]
MLKRLVLAVVPPPDASARLALAAHRAREWRCSLCVRSPPNLAHATPADRAYAPPDPLGPAHTPPRDILGTPPQILLAGRSR